VDHLLAMVRATGLKSSGVGSGAGVGLWVTGEYDGVEVAVDSSRWGRSGSFS